MKIGLYIDAITRPFQHGIRRYAEELLIGLASVDKENAYVLFASKKIKIPEQKNFKLIILPNIPIIKHQIFLSFAVWRQKVDVFHNIEPYGPILLKHPNIVTTIHDLDLKSVYPTFSNIKYFLKRFYSEITRYFVFKHSKTFIAVSQNTRVDLKKYLNKNRMQKNVSVIYEASSLSLA